MSLVVKLDRLRHRDFSEFVEAFGENYCEKLASAYRNAVSSLNANSEATYWAGGVHFLRFFATSSRAQKLRNYLSASHLDKSSPSSEINMQFHFLTAEYRAHLEEKHTNNTTRSNKAHQANYLIRIFSNAGLMPYGLDMPLWKVTLKLGAGSTMLDTTISDEVDINGLLESCSECLEFENISSDEERAEIKTLLSNILLDQKRSAKDDLDIVSSSIVVLSDRIARIKKRCAEIIVEHIKHVNEAKIWFEDGSLRSRAESLKQLFDDRSIGSSGKGRAYQEILGDNALRVGTVFCAVYNARRFPFNKDPYYAVLSSRVPVSEVRRYLGQDATVHAAAFAYICFEVTGNPESIANLRHDSLSHEANQAVLTWIKPRSHFHVEEREPVSERDDSVPLSSDSLSVVDVVKHLKTMAEPLRSYEDEEDQDKLFIANYKNNRKNAGYAPSRYRTESLNRLYKQICLQVSDGRWFSSPKAIRGSLLLLEGLITKDAVSVGKRGRHASLSMPTKYTFHLSEVLRRESNIREFLDWFETILTLDIDDFADKVGIDPDKYEARKQKILNEQFAGIPCANPRAGVQPGTKEGEVCHRIDMCPSCSQRRNIFVLSESNLRSLLHWHVVLDAAQKQLSEADFEPWKLWFVFTNAMLESVEQKAEHAALFERAQRNQEDEVNPYSRIIPVVNLESG